MVAAAHAFDEARRSIGHAIHFRRIGFGHERDAQLFFQGRKRVDHDIVVAFHRDEYDR